jgi:nitroreductase
VDATIDRATVRTDLARAAEFAGLAPSIHNTQPWRWRLRGEVLELRAQRDRQLEVTDPAGHLLMISCGAALHHAMTALTAEGWRMQVLRLPDRSDPDLLAEVTLTARIPVAPQAMRAVQILRVRHTDRRPPTEVPPTREAIEALTTVAAKAGASLHILRPDEIIELAGAADRAQEVELADPQWQSELSYWAGGERPTGAGVPDTAIPAGATQTTVPSRNFGRDGDLPVSAGHDGAAVYGILFGRDDTPGGWLRAGEALSAAWIAAIEHGLSLVPLSAAVEVPTTRFTLRRILANVAEPYLALRIGNADPVIPGPEHTPRLPYDQILDIVP